jgi:very-short-patch-repair endonuclease
MTLRMQNREISKETQNAVADIAKFLEMLSGYYKKDKVGELEL